MRYFRGSVQGPYRYSDSIVKTDVPRTAVQFIKLKARVPLMNYLRLCMQIELMQPDGSCLCTQDSDVGEEWQWRGGGRECTSRGRRTNEGAGVVGRLTWMGGCGELHTLPFNAYYLSVGSAPTRPQTRSNFDSNRTVQKSNGCATTPSLRSSPPS